MTDLATRYRGDTHPFLFDVDAGGSIAGWMFTMTIDSRMEPDDSSTAAVTLSGTIVSNGDASTPGRVKFEPTEEDMDLVGTFYYDVEAYDGAYTETIQYGSVLFVQDRTK